MQSILRNLMIDYDALLLQGMERTESRRQAPTGQRLLDLWSELRRGATAGVENE